MVREPPELSGVAWLVVYEERQLVVFDRELRDVEQRDEEEGDREGMDLRAPETYLVDHERLAVDQVEDHRNPDRSHRHTAPMNPAVY